MLKQITRRAALLLGGMSVGAAFGYGFAPRRHTLEGTEYIGPTPDQSTLNDASLLNETLVQKHVVATGEAGGVLAERVSDEIAEARRSESPVIVSGQRHSMGAQSIPALGHAVTLTQGRVTMIPDRSSFRADAGTLWTDVIDVISEEGYSPKVMQANPLFSIGGSFSVNAHGWAVPHGPMGSTVRSVNLVLADGERLECSRGRNGDLFRLAMGGMGLIGGIVTLECEMTRDVRLRADYEIMPAAEFGARFSRAVLSPDVSLAFGRLNVARRDMFSEAVLVTYSPIAEGADEGLQEIVEPEPGIADRLFWFQEENERVKRLSWWAEATMLRYADIQSIRRNTLLTTPDLPYRNPSRDRTNILHEYFVPLDRFDSFMQACREEIPASYQELLDATVRFVQSDPESYLSYAPAPRIGVFLLFSQEMTRRAEGDHQRMTQALIERILRLGGSYYLPYRLHATKDQFLRAYPRAPEFAAKKREVDPNLAFRNAFWDKYLADL